jgi:hypothetical protein
MLAALVNRPWPSCSDLPSDTGSHPERLSRTVGEAWVRHTALPAVRMC